MGMCIIRNPDGHIMVPHANGLYCLVDPKWKSPVKHANITTGKMSIGEAHCKLGHISHTTIRNAISTGQITGIKLNMHSKPEFCEPCAKAKSAGLPFPKNSQRNCMPAQQSMENRSIGTYGDLLQ